MSFCNSSCFFDLHHLFDDELFLNPFVKFMQTLSESSCKKNIVLIDRLALHLFETSPPKDCRSADDRAQQTVSLNLQISLLVALSISFKERSNLAMRFFLVCRANIFFFPIIHRSFSACPIASSEAVSNN